MSLIKRMRKQYAVYWPPSENDDFGQPIPQEPIEIRCRWEDVQEEYQDLKGEKHVSNAIVYVDRELEIDGYLWEGKLSELESEEPVEAGAYEIKKVNKLPNLRATEFLRTVIL